MSKYLFLLTVSCLSSAAHGQDATEEALAEIIAAQDAAPVTEVAPDDNVRAPATEAVITVTANGLGTDTRNTGQAVTVIDREEIEAVQGADPVRVLQRAPGVSITRNGGVGGFTGVNVRGANSEQVLVLVDGVRVADPASPGGGFDFGNLLLGTAGKFDILRGSNSLIWGSDAIGGVIDVTTRGESGASANLEYGSRDTLFASAAGGLDQEGYFAGLTGSYYRTDGFSTVASGTEPDGFEQLALGGSAFVDLTNNLEVFAHANWSDSDLDLDGFPPPDFTLADSFDTQETRRYWGDVGFAHYSNDLTLRAAYSLSDTSRDNLDGAGVTTFASEGHSERVQLRGEYRAIGPLTVAFGAEHEWTDYETNFDAPAETEISGAYVQLGFAFGRIAAHLGSRVDDHSLFGTNGSYGADISYGFGRDWRVRASLGEGFKAPTLYQLLSDFGNRALRPEESTSFDIGIEKGVRGSGAHVSLTAFRRDSEDLISFVFCPVFGASPCGPGQFATYDNVARARAQGIEAEAGFDLTERFRLGGVFALLDTEDRGTGFDLARRPDYAATVFADYATGFGLRLGADLRLVGEAFDDAANLTSLEGYEVFDLRATMPVNEAFEIYGRVENAFDADYQTVAGYNSAPRGAFVGVRARM